MRRSLRRPPCTPLTAQKASYNEKDYIIAEQLVPEITEGYIKHLRSRAALDEEGQGTNSHSLTMAPADAHAHDNDYAVRDHLHKLAKKLEVGNGIYVWIALSKRTCAHFKYAAPAPAPTSTPSATATHPATQPEPPGPRCPLLAPTHRPPRASPRSCPYAPVTPSAFAPTPPATTL